MVVDNEEDVRAGETNPLILERETTSPKEEVSFFTVIIKLYVLTFLFSTAFQVLAPAQTKIYEMIYCCQHRLEPDQSSCAFRTFPEHLCKTSQIQQEVSTLKGWLEFFDNIPGLVLTIPFGVWADRRGRRKLLLLSITLLAVQQVWITGVTMFADTLPLKAIWLEGLFNVFAGGRTVAEMLVVCIITDVTPRENLSIVFFRLYALSQLSIVLGPAIAAGMMQINPWLAISVGLTLQALCVPIAFSIPETLAWNVESEALHRDVHDKELSTNMGETIHSIIRAGRSALHDFKIIWTDWQFIFLIGLCPFRIMMGALSDLLQRYVSNRYGWTLANATFLSSFQGMASSLVLLLLLPYVTDRLEKKFDLSAVQKNVVISRISLCLLALGYTIQGLAPTVSLLILGLLTESLGLGLGPALRALTGALIERQYNARIYSLIAITETWARMLVYPTVSFIFNAGLERGGIWLGLQFDITAAFALLALVPMGMLKFESRGITKAQIDPVG